MSATFQTTSETIVKAIHEGARIQMDFECDTLDEARSLIIEYAVALDCQWREIEHPRGNWFSFDDADEDEPYEIIVNTFVMNEQWSTAEQRMEEMLSTLTDEERMVLKHFLLADEK